MEGKPLIEPANLPIWTVSGLVVALIALVLAFASIWRTNTVLIGTQKEVVALNNKIEAVKKANGSAALEPAPVASATTVKPSGK